MTVTVFNDALSKLRQEARRRRMLRYKGAARPYKSEFETCLLCGEPSDSDDCGRLVY